ncbi:uncharacterized protein TRIREDRAFT_112371 [Trichoderma reesei QM6a]|uniref:guanylate kinase n=2 Tax=Hypocrea jecorina TaxID=51453 RepID=G0RWW3_HYPJQ|nr:uncharacterized protein TRIREDRAFT_112371 [Trichoderma reesei QM6a]EGR44299.1 predicted protein [Trichoderma reesei QM6a]ETR96670.1 guanylate kinase [Trichoderma reesei RUT C-30]
MASSKLQLTSSKIEPADVRPIVISGPSGVGKGTLIQMLQDAHPGVFTRTVSHTTRKPRVGEVEGVSYFFVPDGRFGAMVWNDAFVEYTFFGGNSYGTSQQNLEDQMATGLVVILEVDVEGVKQMRQAGTVDARYIFIKPPRFDTLETRLRGRNTETEESIEKRLEQATRELDQLGYYDMVIMNDDLAETYKKLEAFIWGSTTR